MLNTKYSNLFYFQWEIYMPTDSNAPAYTYKLKLKHRQNVQFVFERRSIT